MKLRQVAWKLHIATHVIELKNYGEWSRLTFILMLPLGLKSLDCIIQWAQKIQTASYNGLRKSRLHHAVDLENPDCIVQWAQKVQTASDNGLRKVQTASDNECCNLDFLSQMDSSDGPVCLWFPITAVSSANSLYNDVIHTHIPGDWKYNGPLVKNWPHDRHS